MNTYLSVASNTVFQIMSRAATAVVGLIVTRLITSHFGLEAYGQYQIVLSYVSAWWILTDFGLNAVVVREMAADESKLQRLFSHLFSLRTLLGLLLFAVAVWLLIFLPYTAVVRLGVVIASVTILSQGMMGATHAIFQVKLRYDCQFWANLVGSAVFLGLVYLITRSDGSITALVTAFTVSYLVMMLGSLVLARSWVSLVFGRDKAELIRVMQATIPFGLALLFSLGAFKIDAILMSVLRLHGWTNAAAVGIYQLAYKVFELALVVPVFFMNVMYPILVRHFAESRPRFNQTLVRSMLALATGALMASAFIYLSAPWIIQFLAKNQDFSPAVRVLRIFALQLILFYLSTPLMWTLMVLKRQQVLILVYGAAFVFNLLMNLWVIPNYAFVGAAITTALTETLILLLLLLEIRRAWPTVVELGISST